LFWIIFIQFYLLEFDFYINFDPHFFIVIFFSIFLLIENFYLLDLVLILFTAIYFTLNNFKNYILLILSSFNFFIY
jgi:hypothetical protein